jgi:hypothetical protein
MLETAAWDGTEDSATWEGFNVQLENEDTLTIKDSACGVAAKLPISMVLDSDFNLIVWYTCFVSEVFESETETYDTGNGSDSEIELSPTVFNFPALDDFGETDSDMPPLEDVSDSEDEFDDNSYADVPSLQEVSDSSDDGSETDSSELLMPGDVIETFEERLRLWKRAAQDFGEPPEDIPPRAHRLADIVGEAVQALLEFFQPFPGDERVPWDDECREAERFRVLHVSSEMYTIEDA